MVRAGGGRGRCGATGCRRRTSAAPRAPWTGPTGRSPGAGVLSPDGFAVIDDSRTVLLDRRRLGRPAPPGHLDLYFFAYGRDYRGALRAFYRLSGPQPLLPRFALGNWWSRYHRYTAEEYLGADGPVRRRGHPVLGRRDRHGLAPGRRRPAPRQRLDRLHLEPRAVPRPPGVPRRAARARAGRHAQRAPGRRRARLRGALPGDGRRLGIDPASELPIAFDVTDPEFLEAYFEVLHHPLEDQGVDFWWLDWQQGGVTRVAGLDPLWLLNHFHFLDTGRDGRRPLTFSRYAGVGSHRYPIGFSGDTHHHLGVAGLPAVLHRDRLERRLRLVEPRRRRPHLRQQGRRAGHPLGAARGLLADHAAALRRARSTARSRGDSAGSAERS